MHKCTFCGRVVSDGGTLCQEHRRLVVKVREESKHNGKKAFRYVQYRGHVIGFFPVGKDGDTVYRPRYIGMSTHGIPKGLLIDLDGYCRGYTRVQIKKLKAAVLKVAHYPNGQACRPTHGG